MNPNLAAAWLIQELGAVAGLHGRYFPDVAEEGTSNPCLVYQLIEHEEDERTDAGPAEASTVAFQLRIYGDSRKIANGLREEVKTLIQNRAAGPVSCPLGSFQLEGTAISDLADTYTPETKDYGALLVLAIHGARL